MFLIGLQEGIANERACNFISGNHFDASKLCKEVYTVSVLKNMRDFVAGKIDEATLLGSVNNSINEEPDYDFENDPEFMQECADILMPSIIQDMLMDESALEELDEDVRDAFLRVRGYLVENGIMSEATVSLNNPRVTFVRLGRDARKKRLTSIIALKMARKEKTNDFKKYKLGIKIKKENFAKIMQKYGSKAERLAHKLIMQTKRGKVGAVVEQKKTEKAKK